MKRILIATVALSTLASAGALAADLPRRMESAPVAVLPPPSWTGCYVGANVGAAFGRADVNAATGGGISGTNTGFAGGGQIGCDYQFPGSGFVIGIRDLFDATSLKSNGTVGTGALTGATVDSSTKWFNILTGRLGYAVTPANLIYFQGGGAWSRTDQTITSGGVQIGQFANNKGGYVVGGGWEYKFAPNWSGFVEYNYLNFGTSSGATSTGIAVNLKRDISTLLFGINWRL